MSGKGAKRADAGKGGANTPAEPKAEAPKAEAPKAEAPKAEAPKAEAPKAEAPKAPAKKAYVVAPGKAVTSLKGMLKEGDEVKVEYLNPIDGKAALDALVEKGSVVKG